MAQNDNGEEENEKKFAFCSIGVFLFYFAGCSDDSNTSLTPKPPAHIYSIAIVPQTAATSAGTPVSFSVKVYKDGVEDPGGYYTFSSFKYAGMGMITVNGYGIGNISAGGNLNFDSGSIRFGNSYNLSVASGSGEFGFVITYNGTVSSATYTQ